MTREVKEVPRSMLERFEKYVARPRQPGKCHIWTGATVTAGHGQIATKAGRSKTAHRVAWELYVGHVPKDRHVLHACDNPVCVNPEHLFLGTNKQNQMDAQQKGRKSKCGIALVTAYQPGSILNTIGRKRGQFKQIQLELDLCDESGDEQIKRGSSQFRSFKIVK